MSFPCGAFQLRMHRAADPLHGTACSQHSARGLVLCLAREFNSHREASLFIMDQAAYSRRILEAKRARPYRQLQPVFAQDLAGSERTARSRTTGQIMSEGSAINLSLSALGNVVAALTTAKPKSHIPFRYGDTWSRKCHKIPSTSMI